MERPAPEPTTFAPEREPVSGPDVAPAHDATRGSGEPETAEPGAVALVMGGGGARAAYQVGFLRALARARPNFRFPIITGVSAGAINAAHLAAHPGTFAEAVEDLTRLWSSLTLDKVFRVDPRHLVVNAVRWALQLASGGMAGKPRIRSLVDTTPLRVFLTRALGGSEGRIPGIAANVRSGRLHALGISTSSYSTGRSVTWVEGAKAREWSRPQRRAQRASITVDHVMASAAIPLFFPAVQIDEEWYGDGGVRLSAPLSPALHLGAQRIMAISTRFDRLASEVEQPVITGYPPPAQVIGSLMNSIFLDLLDQDAWRVETMNRLLRMIDPEKREDLQVIRLITLRPSRDLGQLSKEYEQELPRVFRFLVRGLGTQETKSPDLLSFLLFDPGYLRLLMDIGERDGEARMGEVLSVCEPGPISTRGEV